MVTSVNFPIILPPNAQELFSLAVGFIAACIFLAFIVNEVKSKQSIERVGIIAFLITLALLFFIWRPA